MAEQIGKGTFAQLFRAQDTFSSTNVAVAIKVMNRSCDAIGIQEIKRLLFLNHGDYRKTVSFVRLLRFFKFGPHICLVFELLGDSLLSFISSNIPGTIRPRPVHSAVASRTGGQTRGFDIDSIRKIAIQLLPTLQYLKTHNFIHADLKPENILFQINSSLRSSSTRVKLIDFGNCLTVQETSAYFDDFELQTLPYRAPEVLFGLPFSFPVDMWSLGCILVELFLGKSLFAVGSAPELVRSINQLLGPFPLKPFSSGKFYSFYKSHGQFDTGSNPSNSHRLLLQNMSKLLQTRDSQFVSFLIGLLQFDPANRLTPLQALSHPFICNIFPFQIVSSIPASSIRSVPNEFILTPFSTEQLSKLQSVSSSVPSLSLPSVKMNPSAAQPVSIVNNIKQESESIQQESILITSAVPINNSSSPPPQRPVTTVEMEPKTAEPFIHELALNQINGDTKEEAVTVTHKKRSKAAAGGLDVTPDRKRVTGVPNSTSPASSSHHELNLESSMNRPVKKPKTPKRISKELEKLQSTNLKDSVIDMDVEITVASSNSNHHVNNNNVNNNAYISTSPTALPTTKTNTKTAKRISAERSAERGILSPATGRPVKTPVTSTPLSSSFSSSPASRGAISPAILLLSPSLAHGVTTAHTSLSLSLSASSSAKKKRRRIVTHETSEEEEESEDYDSEVLLL
eukprot:GILK01010403.1.p1 GENE.GILK01010403.1~~GILK01010403.1.p1  ORF type:complete len:770 (+),score=161.45 GILK01010403.1:266-2311(+)